MKDFKLTDIEGIGPTKSKALSNAGIKSPMDIIIRGVKEFSRVANITTESAEKIVNNVRKQLINENELVEINDIQTLEKFRESRLKIPIRCESLDDMLKGGFETQAIYEVYGPEGSGKTQISLTTVVETLAQGHGVMFIDCEGTFEVERLYEIAEQRGLDIKEGLHSAIYKLVNDSSELTETIQNSIEDIIEKNVRLLVVDGMIGIFRFSYEGRGELYERQNEIERVLKHLKNMSVYLNLCVLLTNQVQSNPDPWGEKEKPVGGHVFGHAVKYIIAIKKGLKNNRIARLVKSPKDAMADYPFFITAEGVSDEEDGKKKVKIPEFNERGLIKTDLLLPT